MNEDNKNSGNDQPTEEKQPSDESQPEYIEISKEELNKIVGDHEKWKESNGNDGKRADLTCVNLQNANLGKVNLAQAIMAQANLQKAYLWGTDLQEADLQEANLQQADLGHANLQKANLLDANLQKAYLSKTKLQQASLNNSNLKNARLEQIEGLSEANIQNANFQGATGLLGNEFAQADVTGTKLPEDIIEFKALETVKETSQNARKIFLAMLLGCVYSWLTIATTTDVRLLTNTASSPLPIIGTEIPIAWFYLAAPCVLICLYLYFHIYLLKLWEALSGLPAIFPDGKRLDERAYPWLLNGLVRRHFKLLKKGRPFIAHEQEFITIFLSWWVVPITMIAFWLRFLPRHDWFGTSFHIILILVSVGLANSFYHACALTLRGNINVPIDLKKFWSDKGFLYSIFKLIIFSVVIFFVGLLFSLLSVGAINGIRAEKDYEPVFGDIYNIEKVVPWTFDKLGYNVFADFGEKIVSEIPSNYGLIAKEERLEFVKGANLKGRNLKNADMYYAFLVKTDLRGALLKSANLSQANLQKADLGGANLQKANLQQANLQQANFRRANLQEANLSHTKLQNANLFEANLHQANLSFSKLQKATLTFAKLSYSDLTSANLKQANLIANLHQAILVGANLTEAMLGKAKLQNANFERANLQGANLQWANLLGAKNLKIDQLSKVKTLYQAKLDSELLKQVKKCCPHLLERPKEETDQKD